MVVLVAYLEFINVKPKAIGGRPSEGLPVEEEFSAAGASDLNAIVKLPVVLGARGVSRAKLYSDIQRGLWPRAVRLGGRNVGWPATEVRAINSAYIAGHNEQQIRSLVRQLEADRQRFASR